MITHFEKSKTDRKVRRSGGLGVNREPAAIVFSPDSMMSVAAPPIGANNREYWQFWNIPDECISRTSRIGFWNPEMGIQQKSPDQRKKGLFPARSGRLWLVRRH